MADVHLPHPTPETEAFWNAARNGELLLERCLDCRHHFLPPRGFCAACSSNRVEHVAATGPARLHSYVINERSPPPWPGRQCVALVDLEEGVRMLTCIVDCEPDFEHLLLDMPLELAFRPVSSEIALPVFRPVGVSR